MRFLDVEDGKPAGDLRATFAPLDDGKTPRDFALSADGKEAAAYLYYARDKGKLVRWNLADGRAIEEKALTPPLPTEGQLSGLQ